MARPVRATSAVASVVLCLAMVPALQGPAQADHVRRHFTPGAPGIGDPYYPLDGNGGYDVRSYDLDLAYDPATDVLQGEAAIRLDTTQDLSSLNLDLTGLEVSAVTVDRRPATWVRDGGELVITPDRGLKQNGRFTVRVGYAGVPETVDDAFGLSGFFHTDDGALVVGQPQVADTWFPSNDHPSDKASFAVAITVPEGLEAVSNGVLRSQRTQDAQTTWEWDAPEPMAPYLAMMAVGELDVRSYRADGIRFWEALDPDLPADVTANARAAFARHSEIIGWLEGYAGPYPFSSSGGVVDVEDRLGFALENQTRPIYSAGSFAGEDPGESVVIHELAHQWYGDDLSLEQWSDIWLNEGFASYFEWLWAEREGERTVQQSFDAAYARPATSAFWQQTIGDPGSEGIFDAAVYTRGAMTLHALRLEVGDEVFFEILRGWAETNAGGTVSTEQFVAYAQEQSGQDLGALFDAWLSTPGKPALG